VCGLINQLFAAGESNANLTETVSKEEAKTHQETNAKLVTQTRSENK
jgi:hypothetical protein